jgi:hypothetical protein
MAMTLTTEDLDVDIFDLGQIADNLAEALNNPALRRQLEAERERILSSIETIRRVLTQDEQAGIRRLGEELRAIRRGEAS